MSPMIGSSIGSIRHFFPTKDELVASALSQVGERVDDRIRRRTGGGMALGDLRLAAVVAPARRHRREEDLVHLAFLAQVAVIARALRRARGRRATAPGAARRPTRPSGADRRPLRRASTPSTRRLGWGSARRPARSSSSPRPGRRRPSGRCQCSTTTWPRLPRPPDHRPETSVAPGGSCRSLAG